MDLSQTFPRSPRDKMSGLVHLPRMADKALASKQNTLGEYIFPCPLDKIILDFLGIDAEEWVRLVHSQNEQQLARWVEKKCGPCKPDDMESVNRQILGRKPDSEDRWKHFYELRDNIDSSRKDVVTWVDLIDLEEGRLMPATQEEKPATQEEKPATQEEKPATQEEKPATQEEKPATQEEKWG